MPNRIAEGRGFPASRPVFVAATESRGSATARGLRGLAATLLFACAGAVWAQANVYQMYYVPIPENEARNLNVQLAGAGTSDTGRSLVSISVVLPNTIIYFDHSEDGYEADITNPVQASSEVWGDGDPSNGFHPDFPGDLFVAGDVILLDQTYDVTAGSGVNSGTDFTNSNHRINGGDRFGSSKALAVTRVFYNTPTPGTILAGATEVEAVSYWAQDYVMPLGQNTPVGVSGGDPFERVWAFVQAAGPDTAIHRNGALVATIGQGQTQVLTAIQEGDEITASGPVQVNLLTGDVLTSVVPKESRWYRIPPVTQWSSEYYTPVGTTNGSNPARYYVFNPGDSSVDVTITYGVGGVSSTNLAVPAGASAYWSAAGDSGVRFDTAGAEPFYVMAVVDAAEAGDVYDWGFSLVPAAGLTGQTVVGWAPAYENPVAGANSPANHVQASPVWVTPVADTTICVDYDRDGVIDDAYKLGYLQTQRLLDNTRTGFDNDMTGALIYSINKEGESPFDAPWDSSTALQICQMTAAETDTQTDIAVVWGQNPNTATNASPAIDAGTTVLAVPKYGVSKRVAPLSEAGIDADGSGTVTPGDSIAYLIEVDNYGALPLNGGLLRDLLPEGLIYDPALNVSYAWDCSGSDPVVCELQLPAIPPFTSVEFPLVLTIPNQDGATTTILSNRVVFIPPGVDPDEIENCETCLPGEATSPVEYADVTTTLSLPATFTPAGPLVAHVNFGNVGTRNADNTGYQVQLPVGLSGVSCVAATCSYDAVTGVVSISGLPTSLSPGQWTGTVLVNFIAPDSPAPFDVVSVVTTTSLQPSEHEPDSAVAPTSTGGGDFADVTTAVSPPAHGVVGEVVHVPVSFSNFGPETAEGVSYALTLPTSGVDAVSCVPNPPLSCSYDAGTGTVTVSGLPDTLASGDSEHFTLRYTPTAPGTFVVTSTIATTSEEPALHATNQANGQTVVAAALGGPGQPPYVADVTASVSPPATADPGETVRVPVRFGNLGPRAAEAVTYTLTLTPGLSDVSCSPSPPVVCQVTGDTVQVTGLPTTLGNGEQVEFDLFYTAPEPPPGQTQYVPVTATITTSTGESNTANNVAGAQTRIVAEGAAVVEPIPVLHPLVMLALGLAMVGLTMSRTRVRD